MEKGPAGIYHLCLAMVYMHAQWLEGMVIEFVHWITIPKLTT